jgi:hypothetical protein
MNSSARYLETDERNAPLNIQLSKSIAEVFPDEDVHTTRRSSQEVLDIAEQPIHPISSSSITLTTKMRGHRTPKKTSIHRVKHIEVPQAEEAAEDGP